MAPVVEEKPSTVKSVSSHLTSARHPPTSQMFNASIVALNEPKGSTLQAIKKYMTGTYMVDIKKLAPFIKRHIKKSVEEGTLIQTTGVGASGKFKLSGKTAAKKTEAKASSTEVKKNVLQKTVKSPAKRKVKATENKSPTKTAASTKKKTPSVNKFPSNRPGKPKTTTKKQATVAGNPKSTKVMKAAAKSPQVSKKATKSRKK